MARFEDNIQNVRGSITNLSVKVHGGPGSGRYPKGSGEEAPLSSIRLSGNGLRITSKKSEEELKKEFSELRQSWKNSFDKFTFDEKYSLTEYVGSELSWELNSHLRGREENVNLKRVRELELQANTLSSAIEKQEPLPEGVELFRGLRGRSADKMSSAKVGEICQDRGFQSFTMDPYQASFHATYDDEFKDSVVMRTTTDGKIKALGGSPREMELIFNKNSAWKVTAVDTLIGREGEEGQKKFTIVSVMPHD